MFENVFNYFYKLYLIYDSSDLYFKIIFWFLISCGFAWLIFEFFGEWNLLSIQRHKNRRVGK